MIPSKRLWGFAFALAVLVHAGGLAAVWSRLEANEDDDQLGARAIETGLELTAPREEDAGLPPGPEAEASAASTPVPDQKAKVAQTDLPKDQPVDTDDPARRAAPDAAKTPKDDTPNRQEAKANPVAESVTSEAAAPPRVDTAHEAARSAAPTQGTGDNVQRVKATWQKELVAHLNRFKRYPSGAAPRGVPVVVSFTLDRTGHVVSASLRQSSGDAAFDQAALTMMARADPVPAPPPRVADEGLEFTIPVIFRDKKK